MQDLHIWVNLGKNDLRKKSMRRILINGYIGNSEDKESTCNAGDSSLIPGSGRSPGEGNGNPLQYSCLEHPMGIGAWRGQRVVHELSD